MLERQRLDIDCEIWEAMKQGAYRQLSFQTCERCPDAEVSAVAEGEMPVVRTEGIEAVRVWEASRITIGRPKPEIDKLTGAKMVTLPAE